MADSRTSESFSVTTVLEQAVRLRKACYQLPKPSGETFESGSHTLDFHRLRGVSGTCLGSTLLLLFQVMSGSCSKRFVTMTRRFWKSYLEFEMLAFHTREHDKAKQTTSEHRIWWLFIHPYDQKLFF